MRNTIGGIVAVLAAAAAFGGAPAPAMAQDEWCFEGTGTSLDGKCIREPDTQPDCIRGICVEGLWENVAAAQLLVEQTIAGVGPLWERIDELAPDRVCTPSLLAGPICVTP